MNSTWAFTASNSRVEIISYGDNRNPPSELNAVQLTTDLDILTEDPNSQYMHLWVKTGDVISIDMSAARAEILSDILEVRNKRLTYLDALQVIALGQSDTAEVTRLEDIKQLLRDLPSTLDMNTYSTFLELRQVFPSVLNAE